MRKIEHIILILFIILLGCGIVEAAPPFESTVFAGDSGLHLEVNALDYYKQGAPRWQVIQIFNKSNGYQFTNDTSNITCILKLRNGSGFEIKEKNATVHDEHWDINGSAGVNNPIGTYAWTIVCQDGTTKKGGYVSGYFEITTSGTSDANNSIMLIGVLFVFALLLLFFSTLLVTSEKAWLKLLLILPVTFLVMISMRFMSWFISIDYPEQLGLINVLDIFYMFGVVAFYVFLAIIPVLMLIVLRRDRKRIAQEERL